MLLLVYMQIQAVYHDSIQVGPAYGSYGRQLANWQDSCIPIPTSNRDKKCDLEVQFPLGISSLNSPR